MRPGRRVYPLAVLALLATAAPAVAGPRPVCRPVLTDRSGDALWGAADVLAGFLAAGRTEVAARLVVAGDRAADPPVRPDTLVEFRFAVRGVPVVLSYRGGTGPTGPGDEAAATIGGEPVEVVARVTRDSVLWRIARREFPMAVEPGAVVDQFAAGSSVAGLPTDEARSDQTYRWHAPSCFKAH